MKLRAFRAPLGAIAGVCLAVAAVPAQANNLRRDGFAFPAEGQVKIVVFRPDVQVGSLRAGGLDEPNADWTAQARTNMQAAFESAAEAKAAQLEFLGDPEGDNAKLLNDYRGLFKVVSGEILNHGVFLDRFPTKLAAPEPAKPGKAGKRYKLEWTLGGGASKLKEITGADYAMFVYTHDSYGDAGRKVAQFLMAGLFGAYVPAGIHIGYAGLVDLNTGDIVWFNADPAMGGDPRETDGATKRVSQLMAGFPARGGAAAAPAPELAAVPAAVPAAEPAAEPAPEPAAAPTHEPAAVPAAEPGAK